jgi:hypothetical protein
MLQRLNELILDEYCTNSLDGQPTGRTHQNYMICSLKKHLSTRWSAVFSLDDVDDC